jgi:hypothetical protein
MVIAAAARPAQSCHVVSAITLDLTTIEFLQVTGRSLAGFQMFIYPSPYTYQPSAAMDDRLLVQKLTASDKNHHVVITRGTQLFVMPSAHPAKTELFQRQHIPCAQEHQRCCIVSLEIEPAAYW